jgi:hypothetical protein
MIEHGQTLSFEEFWRWVVAHPNCVIRAGTEEVFLYDLEEFHWYFTEEPDKTPLVQLIRGKQLVAVSLPDEPRSGGARECALRRPQALRAAALCLFGWPGVARASFPFVAPVPTFHATSVGRHRVW